MADFIRFYLGGAHSTSFHVKVVTTGPGSEMDQLVRATIEASKHGKVAVNPRVLAAEIEWGEVNMERALKILGDYRG